MKRGQVENDEIVSQDSQALDMSYFDHPSC